MSGSQQAPATAPHVRKASSLLDLRKRMPTTPGKPIWGRSNTAENKVETRPATSATESYNHNTVNSMTSLASHSTTASSVASSAWTKLKNNIDHVTHGSQQGSAEAENVGLEAYLRVRPLNAAVHNGHGPGNVSILSSNEACMATHVPSSPSEAAFCMPRSASSMALASNASQSSTFSFTEIFPESAGQSMVYQKTALFLVKNLIGASESGRMDNSLIFAYGVSGGGKTYTVQGSPNGDPGLIPRALDTVMNSLRTKQTASHLRPCRLTGLEITPKGERLPAGKIPTNVGFDSATVRRTLLSNDVAQIMKRDPTVFDLPEAYHYSVWISYAEVYNEKIFDLFDTSDKRKALSLKTDRQAGSKYVQGLKEVRVWSNEDAQSLLQKGQINRSVFSTLLNGASSRSHSIFTIKVVRLSRSVDPEDANAFANISRMSIVDLAGSERSRNANTAGDRLKEAGNINKSLMVLGQCMEVMRKNQEDRLRGKKPAIVPFRHSKLTEIFQSFFTGDGKAVLIAAINPFQTAYDENLAVLKFASVARQITTTQTASSHTAQNISSEKPSVPRYQQPLQRTTLQRQVSQASTASGNVKGLPGLPTLTEDASMTVEDADTPVEEEDDTQVLDQTSREGAEEDADEVESYDSEDEASEEDMFVTHLLSEIRDLRIELAQTQMSQELLITQALTRAREEYSTRRREMERDFEERMAEAERQAEVKMDKKIDILMKARMAHKREMQEEGSASGSDDGEDEEDIESDASDAVGAEQLEEASLFQASGGAESHDVMQQTPKVPQLQDESQVSISIDVSSSSSAGDTSIERPASAMTASTSRYLPLGAMRAVQPQLQPSRNAQTAETKEMPEPRRRSSRASVAGKTAVAQAQPKVRRSMRNSASARASTASMNEQTTSDDSNVIVDEDSEIFAKPGKKTASKPRTQLRHKGGKDAEELTAMPNFLSPTPISRAKAVGGTGTARTGFGRSLA